MFFALDPGTSVNSFALAGTARDREGRWYPVCLREWIPTPGHPLDITRQVAPEAARIVRAHGGDLWITDAASLAEVRIIGNEYGIQTVCASTDMREQWRHVYAVTARRQHAWAPRQPLPLVLGSDGTWRPPLTQPPDAETIDRLRSQLATVQRRPGEQGRWVIKIPTIDGAHGDLASAYARALALANAGDEDRDVSEPFDARRFGSPSRYDLSRRFERPRR